MDMLKKVNTGVQVILGAGVLFLIFSFFNWFEVKHTSYGESMWHGIGVVAGLLLVAVLIWEGLKAANIDIRVGISSSMITGALSVLLLLFTFIRFIDKPGGGFADAFVDRTVWAWIGLILAVIVVGGAWLNMQAAGESLADVKATLSSMTSGAGSGGATASTAPPTSPGTSTPSAAEPPTSESAPASGEEPSAS